MLVVFRTIHKTAAKAILAVTRLSWHAQSGRFRGLPGASRAGESGLSQLVPKQCGRLAILPESPANIVRAANGRAAARNDFLRAEGRGLSLLMNPTFTNLSAVPIHNPRRELAA
jgi:hypothetical protein